MTILIKLKKYGNYKNKTKTGTKQDKVTRNYFILTYLFETFGINL